MGYRIEYGPMPKLPKAQPPGSLRLRALTAAFLLLFTLTVRQAWPEGTELLQRFLLPGEPSVTEAAFGELVAEIRDGAPLEDAFTAFCRQIIEDEIPEIY